MSKSPSTQLVSSNITLILKFALPTAWIVFFGSLTIAFWLTDSVKVIADIPMSTFRHIVMVFFLVGLALIYWSMMNLKRVELDPHFLYATNYFKHIRYPYHQIEKIEEKDYYFFRTIHVHLKTAGQFGKSFPFIASHDNYDKFFEEHPEIEQQITFINREE